MSDLPVWDDLSTSFRALIQTLLFFFAPATVATGFSENMILRFVQTLGVVGLVFLGLTIAHDMHRAENGGDGF